MKLMLVMLALLFLQTLPRNEAPVAKPEHMKYQRSLSMPGGSGQVCAVLDGQVFPHAAPSLKDLRLFPTVSGRTQANAPREVPYAITLSETDTDETRTARVLNLGTSGGPSGSSGTQISFDLEMPGQPYSEVALDLAGQDFLATATVSGMDAPGAGKPIALGVFTLFDLSSQHLWRDTMLPLPESTFPYLHVVLSVSRAPGNNGTRPGDADLGPAMVRGAQVPPSREAQTLYTTVAETSAFSPVGQRRRSASFSIPERVPVERVTFVIAPEFKSNFSRSVKVTATTEPVDPHLPEAPEIVSGVISRVHTTEAGRVISTEQLSIPAVFGANMQRPAKIEVVLDNGDDQPLPVAAVRLEMRQRKLCFDAPAGGNSELTLYYGDPTLLAPEYDYDRLFVALRKPLASQLGPELPNPVFHPLPAALRPFTERHPEVLWIALIGVICALGVVALRSSRNEGLR